MSESPKALGTSAPPRELGTLANEITENEANVVTEAIKTGFTNLTTEIRAFKADIIRAMEAQQLESEYRMHQQLGAFFQHGALFFNQQQRPAPFYHYGSAPMPVSSYVSHSMSAPIASPANVQTSPSNHVPENNTQSTQRTRPPQRAQRNPRTQRTQPTSTTIHARTSPPTEPSQPAELNQTEKRNQSAESDKPTEFNESAESGESSEPTQSIERNQPVQSEQIGHFTQFAQPTQFVQHNTSTSINTCDTSSPPRTPLYRLSRSLKTVLEVWREYTVGLAGGPAVDELESTYGTFWRKERKESRFFSRRSIIYNEIKKISDEHNVPLEEAANMLERRRIELGKSLDGLGKVIKASYDQGEE